MLPTKSYTYTIGASQSIRVPVIGQMFKILAATGTVSVSSDFGALTSLTTGQGLEKTPFQYLLLTDTSGASNTVTILIGDENFIDSSVIGQVTLTGTTGNPGQNQKTVTNVSSIILASNANRKYMFIQNNDPVGIVYLGVDWNVATVAKGIRLLPGDSIEYDVWRPVGAITAIGDIASNPNVVTVEI